MKLFIDYGVQATPMSAIAKAANTGMGTIYNYFATKEELINGIYLYIKQDEIKKLFDEAGNVPVKKNFDLYFRALIVYFFENPVHFQFMDQFHNSPIITPETKQEGAKAVEPLSALIAKGQEQGIIKNISFEEILHFVNGGLMGFIRWVLNSKIEVTAQLTDNQVRIAWDAIKE